MRHMEPEHLTLPREGTFLSRRRNGVTLRLHLLEPRAPFYPRRQGVINGLGAERRLDGGETAHCGRSAPPLRSVEESCRELRSARCDHPTWRPSGVAMAVTGRTGVRCQVRQSTVEGGWINQAPLPDTWHATETRPDAAGATSEDTKGLNAAGPDDLSALSLRGDLERGRAAALLLVAWRYPPSWGGTGRPPVKGWVSADRPPWPQRRTEAHLRGGRRVALSFPPGSSPRLRLGHTVPAPGRRSVDLAGPFVRRLSDGTAAQECCRSRGRGQRASATQPARCARADDADRPEGFSPLPAGGGLAGSRAFWKNTRTPRSRTRDWPRPV
jgi:hypothetical protein